MIGLLDRIIDITRYPMIALDLPTQTAKAYIFGFFRRDYGTAGLYDMQKNGLLTVNQLTTAVITMTLFPACIAQVLMMIKERGTKSGIAIFIFCILMAFSSGTVFSRLLKLFKLTL